MNFQKQEELEKRIRHLEEDIGEDSQSINKLIKLTDEILSNFSTSDSKLLFTHHEGNRKIEYYAKPNGIYRTESDKSKLEKTANFVRWCVKHYGAKEYVNTLKYVVGRGDSIIFDYEEKPRRPNPFLRLVTQYKTARIKRTSDSEENNNT